MRVRIEKGSSSIEVEGDFAEVERVLSTFWVSTPAADEPAEIAEDSGKPAVQRRSAKRPAKRQPTAANSAVQANVDVDNVVNRIRDDARYELFKRKVLMIERGRSIKAKFVSWYLHDTPLTTGTVHKILSRLGVKLDASGVSRAMSGDAKDDYLTDRSGTQPTYALTMRAHAAFGAWLLEEDSAAA